MKELGLIHSDFTYQDVGTINALRSDSSVKRGSGIPNLQGQSPTPSPPTEKLIVTNQGLTFDKLINKFLVFLRFAAKNEKSRLPH
jgi:hypothetical protein